MKVTINFGISNSITREFPSGTTVGDVLRNGTVRSALSFGDNVSAKIDGVTQDANKVLYDGDEIDLENRANSKALNAGSPFALLALAFACTA